MCFCVFLTIYPRVCRFVKLRIVMFLLLFWVRRFIFSLFPSWCSKLTAFLIRLADHAWAYTKKTVKASQKFIQNQITKSYETRRKVYQGNIIEHPIGAKKDSTKGSLVIFRYLKSMVNRGSFLKRCLQHIAHKTVPEQIEILEKYLEKSKNYADSLAIGKLLREKKWLAKQSDVSGSVSISAAEKSSRLSNLCNRLRLYLIGEQWDEAQELTQKIMEEGYDLLPEQMNFLQDVLQKLKAQKQKSLPSPIPDAHQIAMGKMSAFITNGDVKAAREIADKLLQEEDKFWVSPERDAFLTMLTQLKSLETDQEINLNLPARITALEEEKEMLKKENQTLIIVKNERDSQVTQTAQFLKRLNILMCDPTNLTETRELVNYIKSDHVGELSTEQTEFFIHAMQVLQEQEAKQKHQQNLEVEVGQLQQKLLESQKKHEELEKKYQETIREKESLQPATVSLKQAQQEIERLKKLAATVAAYVYNENKSALKSNNQITFFINDYIDGSKRGANPAHPASVRNVILRHFQDCFAAYEQLMNDDSAQ